MKCNYTYRLDKRVRNTTTILTGLKGQECKSTYSTGRNVTYWLAKTGSCKDRYWLRQTGGDRDKL